MNVTNQAVGIDQTIINNIMKEAVVISETIHGITQTFGISKTVNIIYEAVVINQNILNNIINKAVVINQTMINNIVNQAVVKKCKENEDGGSFATIRVALLH